MLNSSIKDSLSPLLAKLEQYQEYYEPQLYEIPIYRFWALTVAFFLPLYGILLQIIEPTAIDYISHRLLLSAYWGIVVVASFYMSSVKKNLIVLSYLGNYLWTSWVVWIVYMNSFSISYSIGLFVAFCVAGITFRTLKSMLWYFGILLSIIFIVLTVATDVQVNKYMLGLSLVIIVIVYAIIMYQRTYVSRNLAKLNSDLRELNLKLEEKTLNLQAKNKELERFASIASHDLKAPLRTISAFAGIISKRTASFQDPKIQECTQYLEGGVKRMVKIIDDLLEYSRLGQLAIVYEPTNLDKLLFIVLNSIVHNKNRPDIKIIIPKSLPKEVICNSRQIEQLFQNLIDNAIKYNRSEIKSVWITYKESEKAWTFTVKDNGIGIPQKFKEQVFEMFKRLHGTQEFKGTGIGLAICKRIVANHKGIIAIESVEGKGATFTFSISKSLPYTPKIVSVKTENLSVVAK